jgi:uncharacterized protein (TIGR02266 family)
LTTEFRKNIRLEVYIGQDHQILMTNYAVNMSTGGLFLETDKIRPVDTSLVVRFKLPGNNSDIVSKARVAWTNEPGGLKKFSLPPGMGIQFIDLSLENLQAIRDFLKEGDLKPSW